jgi:hypothetical protein
MYFNYLQILKENITFMIVRNISLDWKLQILMTLIVYLAIKLSVPPSRAGTTHKHMKLIKDIKVSVPRWKRITKTIK